METLHLSTRICVELERTEKSEVSSDNFLIKIKVYVRRRVDKLILWIIFWCEVTRITLVFKMQKCSLFHVVHTVKFEIWSAVNRKIVQSLLASFIFCATHLPFIDWKTTRITNHSLFVLLSNEWASISFIIETKAKFQNKFSIWISQTLRSGRMAIGEFIKRHREAKGSSR